MVDHRWSRCASVSTRFVINRWSNQRKRCCFDSEERWASGLSLQSDLIQSLDANPTSYSKFRDTLLKLLWRDNELIQILNFNYSAGMKNFHWNGDPHRGLYQQSLNTAQNPVNLNFKRSLWWNPLNDSDSLTKPSIVYSSRSEFQGVVNC